jgi:hypothetical protein
MRQLMFFLLVAVLAACSEPTPSAPPAEANDNPLQGTVLQDQGEVLRRAKEVEDAINNADQERRDQIDAAE